MKIEIKKITPYECAYKLIRKDLSVELIQLETKTYFIHDICHFVVEKNLKYLNGFWGMLAQGYSFDALFGKDNVLTKELRFIEQIVGPVQSLYLGNIPKQNFDLFVQHIDFTIPEGLLEICLSEIKALINNWEHLPTGEQLLLKWDLDD